MSVIDDPNVLNGLSQILNKDNMDKSVKYSDIEKNMVNGGFVVEDENPSDEFKNQLQELSEKLGVSLDDFNSNDPQNSLESQLLNNTSSITMDKYLNSNQSNQFTSSNVSNQSNLSNVTTYTDPNEDDDSDSSDDSDDNIGHINDMALDQNIVRNMNNNQYIPKTEEEERRSITQGVVNELSSESTSKLFSLDKERREHERGIKLEKIDELRKTLDSEKIDLTNVPAVTRNSKDEEIDYSLKILILKNDRIRFHTVAEELILLGAYGLEEIFDGKRTFLGKYRPDLQGWHTHVSSKLRRMRYDTSTLVSNVMSEYNIGSVGRIMLELVPNAFMYSRKKSRSRGSETLYSQEQAEAARSGIRDKDEPF